jgi:hypothetical protein
MNQRQRSASRDVFLTSTVAPVIVAEFPASLKRPRTICGCIITGISPILLSAKSGVADFHRGFAFAAVARLS